jgi:putative aldouronate transport system substrate-binding protein
MRTHKNKKEFCMKKLLAVLCLAVIGLPLFAGGGQASSGGRDVDFTQSAPEGYAVPEAQGGGLLDEFSIFAGWIVRSPDNTVMQDELKKVTGMRYHVTGTQTDDAQTAINLMLASGQELADLIVVNRNTVVRNALIQSGKVMELTSLYNSKSLKVLPNIPVEVKKFIAESDGKTWVIPGQYAYDWNDPFPGWTLEAFWIRQDLLKQVGAAEQDFATIEGFENVLRKFKALKDLSGNPLIPMSFIMGNNNHQEKLIAAMFGVDMVAGVSGMPPVMNINGKNVFAYDNPDYYAAFNWMNKMYREGLIDMEVTTQTAERFQEKLENGQVASYAGAHGQGMWDYTKGMNGPEDNPAKWWMYPYQSPKVSGKTKQAVTNVNPYPSVDMFISKNTKHLNAVLHYLEWSHEPVYYRTHEVENGPVGTTWYFTDAEKKLWEFEPKFEADRSSGDEDRRYSTSPQIYQTGITASGFWYPWFNQAPGNLAKGNFLLPEYCQYIGKNIVNQRLINDMDLIQASTDGVIAANLSNMNQVVDEYTAKMIMARSEADCAAAYREFLQMLELRAKWSDMKTEWERLYAAR